MRGRTIVSLVALVVAVAGVPASAANKPPTGCLRFSDPADDQVLFFGYPPDTTGMGIKSLDFTRIQAAIDRKGFVLTWHLSELQRPAPGQSWVYRFEFQHAEATYAVTAQMQALAGSPGALLTDRFLIGEAKASTDVTEHVVSGRFDLEQRTITIRVTARDLGVRETSHYSMRSFTATTSQAMGNTVGVGVDDAFSPEAKLYVGVHRGC